MFAYHFGRGPQSRFPGYAALVFFCFTLSCSQGENSAEKGSAGADKTTSNPAAAVTPPAAATIDQVAELLAGADAFGVTPATVAQHFQPVAELRAGTADEDTRRFVGSTPAQGVHWALADFQAAASSAQAEWELLYLHVALAVRGANGESTFQQLRAAVTRRVGEPAHDDPDQALAVWQLKDHHELILREAEVSSPLDDGNPLVVILEAAVAQGEVDN